MNKKNNHKPIRRKKRKSVAAGIGSVLMMLAATVCVAMAVVVVLEYRLDIDDGFTSAIASVVPAFGENVIPAFVVPPETEPIEQETTPEHPTTEVSPTTPTPETEIEYIPDDTTTPAVVPEPTPPPTPLPTPSPTPGELADSPFNAFSFYIPQNAHLYEYFSAERPDLDNETVVWMVNTHLHTPFYSDIRINHAPNPLLVNPFYRLPYGFEPHDLVPVNSEDCFLRATPEAVAAFRALRTAARLEDLDLSVTSAYRTATRQAELFEQQGFRDGAVARPHHSEHQTGRALDLWGPGGLLDASGPSPTGTWVTANAHYHGFIIRYRADTTHITGFIHEPWHITYVGTQISMYMHVNNILSLEEFVGRNPGVALPSS